MRAAALETALERKNLENDRRKRSGRVHGIPAERGDHDLPDHPLLAHGYDLAFGGQQQKLAVESGYWPLYRFDPRRKAAGLPPLQLDSDPPKIPISDYMHLETRYRMLEHLDPERARKLVAEAQAEADHKFSIYRQLSDLQV